MSIAKIYLVLTDDNRTVAIGGVKQAYRHVDVLNSLGYDAMVLLDDVSLRCQWFKNDTRIASRHEVSLEKGDYLFLPEGLPGIPSVRGIEKAEIVIYAQNPYTLFIRGFGGLNNVYSFYKERVRHVLCVSDHSLKYLSRLIPFVKIHRIRYSFDREPFGLGEQKERIVSYMTRRRGEDMDRVLAILNGIDTLKEWRIQPIADKTENEVAKLLKKSTIFMSGSFLEGCPMPPAEAMACGCVVVGWSGCGGHEYFKEGISFEIDDNDILAYADTMMNVFQYPHEELIKIGIRASEFIRSEYSVEKERQSISQAWSEIVNSKPVEISSKKMDGVAVLMVTHNEGPYLGHLLKWYSQRVGRVYVVEGKDTFSGFRDSSQSRTKIVVDGVEASNIKYMEVKGSGNSDPMLHDAHFRNKGMEAIEKDGYEWVWIVDADEAYTNEEADRLWDWFFNTALSDVFVVCCSWYTYWRSMHYRIEPKEPYLPDIIARSNCRFGNSRIISCKRRICVPESVCMVRHYSWAKSPSDILQKISTWGHANEVLKGWYENIFLAWKPECKMTNLHPTKPQDYIRAIRCNLPLPEALKDHPYVGKDLIEEKALRWKYKVKAVILNHNMPENADKLYEQLAPVFDDVEIFDSGSDSDKIPIHLGRSFPNIYWTGAWNEIMRTCQNYDAVWMLGCDVTLEGPPEKYRLFLEESLPFGCWSPSIEGRAHPFMRTSNYGFGHRARVKNIEGMAMAISGELMKKVQKLVDGSPIGFGQDFWLCHMARKNGLANYIEGRVAIHHPERIGYDEREAHRQMEQTFSALYGKDYRKVIFEYSESYEGNLMKEESQSEAVPVIQESSTKSFTIITVDNGWGYPEFVRITSNFLDARKIVMAKGVAELSSNSAIEVVKSDVDLNELIKQADIALFTKIGAANRTEYEKILKAGVPVIVQVAHQYGTVKHMEDGFVYLDESWAVYWIRTLMDDPGLRQKVRDVWKERSKSKMVGLEKVREVCPSCAERMEKMNLSAVKPDLIKTPWENPLVTIITPTYRRNPDIVRRCMDCMRLQSMLSWEQLVCSDGEKESCVEALIQSIGDERIHYHFTEGKKQGDFGNTVRAEMLKKARGKYILFFDDDNLILPNYLQKMTDALEGTENDFVLCRIIHFGPLNEAEVGKPPKILLGIPMKLYHIDPLQILVKREVISKIGWDTQIGYLSDGVTLEKLGNGFKGVRVEEILGIHL